MTTRAKGSLIAYVGANTPVGYDASGGRLLIDRANNVVYEYQFGTPGTGLAGIKALQGDVPGNEIAQATEVGIFGDAGGGIPNHLLSAPESGICYHPGTNDIFTVIDSGPNTAPVARIDADTLTETEIFGEADTSTSPSTNGPPARLLASFQLLPATKGASNYVVSHSLFNEVAVLDVTTTGGMTLVYVANLTEGKAHLGPGPDGRFFAFGGGDSGFTTSVGFYRFDIAGGVVTRSPVRTFVPTDIDASWGVWFSNTQLCYDKADGNVVCMFAGGASLLAPADYYLLKLDAVTGEILWQTAVDLHWASLDLSQCSLNRTLNFFNNPNMKHVDLADGTITSTAWNNGFSMGTQTFNQAFDYATGRVTANLGYSASTGPVPTYLGDYLANNADVIPGNRWGGLFAGVEPAGQSYAEVL